MPEKLNGMSSQLDKLSHQRWLLNFIVAGTCLAISTGYLLNRRWFFGLVWIALAVMWSFNGNYQRQTDKSWKEIIDGYRRDAENDQSGAASGAGGQADEVAASGEATGFTAGASITVTDEGTSLDVVRHDPVEPVELEVYTAPVWGFRGWDYQTGGALPLLLSGYSGTRWLPGKNQARCQKHEGTTKEYLHCSDCPGDRCLCGFHALRDVFDAITYGHSIVGGIVGWGKVIDGETGWRSQYAAPAALLERPVFLEDAIGIPPPIYGSELPTRTAYMAELYNIPLCRTLNELMEKTQEMAEWMAGDDLKEERDE